MVRKVGDRVKTANLKFHDNVLDELHKVTTFVELGVRGHLELETSISLDVGASVHRTKLHGHWWRPPSQFNHGVERIR